MYTEATTLKVMEGTSATAAFCAAMHSLPVTSTRKTTCAVMPPQTRSGKGGPG